MKRARLTPVLFWLLLTFASALEAQVPELRLTITTRSLGSGDLIDVDAVSATTSFDSYEAERRSKGSYRVVIEPQMGGAREVLIEIETGSTHTPRSFRVRVPANQSSWRGSVSLQVDSVQVTDKYYLKGLPLFTSNIDGALCHFEYGYRAKGEEVDWPPCWVIRLRYNYARALHNACTVLNYNTCNEARGLAERLQQDYAQDEEGFHCATVTAVMLQQIVDDAEAVSIQADYAAVPALFRRGDYLASAREAEELLLRYSGAPLEFRDRLLEDAGVAYLLSAQEGIKSGTLTQLEINDQLRKSESRLEEMEQPTGQALENLQIARELQSIQSPKASPTE